MKRVALYIRVSTDEQAKHGYSIAEQKHELEEYAVKKGYTIVDMYADEGATARKSISRRKGLQRLLRDVQSGSIDIIVMKCLDRWFRNIRDYYRVQDILDKYKVVWECTQEDYNTTTTNGRLMLNLKLTIAQNESDTTGDRIRYIQEGMKRRKEPITGNVPMGYIIDKKSLVVDDSTAPIIKFVYESVAAGKSLTSLLSAIKLRFHTFVSRRQLHRMVRNRSYIGEFYGVPDYAPPIIDDELFNRVQAILATHKRISSRGNIFLFAGLIKCPLCGHILAGVKARVYKNGHRYIYHRYRCQNRYIARVCSYATALGESRLEKWLVANIQRVLADRWYQIYHGKAEANTRKAELAQAKEKLRRLKVLFLDAVIDLDEYKSTYKTLIDRVNELEKAEVKAKILPTAAQSILDIDDFPALYEKLSREHRAELWHSLIESIEYDFKPLRPETPLDFRITFLP